MSTITSVRRRAVAVTAACLTTIGMAGAAAFTVGAGSAGAAVRAPHAKPFTFKLIPSPGISACMPGAGGKVTITKGSQNDTMTVSIHGMRPNTGFDLFVIQEPNKPFGVAWYQTDVNAGRDGEGSATVKGIFSRETFSVNTTPTVPPGFAPTHQYHLGLWFSNPNVPFTLGCETGATSPIITPFNGEQHAGIQALNTAQFQVDAGPLSKVH